MTEQLTLDPKRDNQQFGKLPIAGVIAVSDSWEIEQLSELRPRLKTTNAKGGGIMDDRAGNELPLTSYYRTEKHGRNFHYKIRGIWK